MSIDCRELRIGNWVMVDKVEEEGYPSTINQVSGIDVDGGVWVEWRTGSGDSLLCLPNQVLPIPLTEEVLKNCGFVLHQIETIELPWFEGTKHTTQSWNYDDRTYVHRIISDGNADTYKVYNRVITSLHELQNQMYFFRKTELIYTP